MTILSVEGWNKIINIFTGLYLSARGSSLETRANESSDEQLWRFDSEGRIVNRGSNLVIDGSNQNPTLTDASPLTGSKIWKLRTDIQNPQDMNLTVPKLVTSGGLSCLQTADRFLENGSPVIMYPCTEVHPDNAGWNIVPGKA